MKVRKRVGIGCGAVLVLIALVTGFLAYSMFGIGPVYAKDVPQHSLAPAAATSIEVSEARNISGAVSLTYLVGEEDFRKFAVQNGWSLESASGAVTVRPPSDDFDEVRELKLNSYLYYQKRQSNGAGINVCYDPSEGRAYIENSNR